MRSRVVTSLASMRWLRSRRVRFALVALALLLVAPVVGVVVASFFVPLPPELALGRPPATGAVLRDRDGMVLRELLADDGARARWIRLDDAGKDLPRALIAAEDRRFFYHPGVDPLAVARAFGQLLGTGGWSRARRPSPSSSRGTWCAARARSAASSWRWRWRCASSGRSPSARSWSST